MINLITGVSKYVIILLLAWYTLLSFRCLTLEDGPRMARLCRRARAAVLLLHLTGFLVLLLRQQDAALLLFYGAQLLFLLLYPYVFCKLYKHASRQLLNHVLLLLTLGFIMLTRLDQAHAMRQFVIVSAAALLTLPLPYLMDKVWKLCDLWPLYAGAGLLSLALVLLIGSYSYGAKMTLQLGGAGSLQPAEFVKLSFVFFIASRFQKSNDFRSICLTSVLAAAHILILILCRDLGTALLFFVTYTVLLYLATNRSLYLLLGGSMICGAGLLAYQLFAHVRNRVAAWMDPFADIANKGYQMAHSLFAIGTGGLLGMGLGMGMPDKIPIVEKDFIFSAISEELGALSAVCLILVCLCCFLQMMMTAMYMELPFYRLLAAGLGVSYIMQVFLTVGGAVKFIPSTGVTLPFVAYGGSSVLASFCLFSVIQGLHLILIGDAEAAEAEEVADGRYEADDFPEEAADGGYEDDAHETEPKK